jgi:hypothetical protein
VTNNLLGAEVALWLGHKNDIFQQISIPGSAALKICAE